MWHPTLRGCPGGCGAAVGSALEKERRHHSTRNHTQEEIKVSVHMLDRAAADRAHGFDVGSSTEPKHETLAGRNQIQDAHTENQTTLPPTHPPPN